MTIFMKHAELGNEYFEESEQAQKEIEGWVRWPRDKAQKGAPSLVMPFPVSDTAVAFWAAAFWAELEKLPPNEFEFPRKDELRRRIFDQRQDPALAVREMWGDKLENVSTAIRQAIERGLAAPAKVVAQYSPTPALPSRESLETTAAQLDIRVDGRWSNARLAEEIRKVEDSLNS